MIFIAQHSTYIIIVIIYFIITESQKWDKLRPNFDSVGLGSYSFGIPYLAYNLPLTAQRVVQMYKRDKWY